MTPDAMALFAKIAEDVATVLARIRIKTLAIVVLLSVVTETDIVMIA